MSLPAGTAGHGGERGAESAEPLAAFSAGALSTSNGILTLSWGLDAVSVFRDVRQPPGVLSGSVRSSRAPSPFVCTCVVARVLTAHRARAL